MVLMLDCFVSHEQESCIRPMKQLGLKISVFAGAKEVVLRTFLFLAALASADRRGECASLKLTAGPRHTGRQGQYSAPKTHISPRLFPLRPVQIAGSRIVVSSPSLACSCIWPNVTLRL